MAPRRWLRTIWLTKRRRGLREHGGNMAVAWWEHGGSMVGALGTYVNMRGTCWGHERKQKGAGGEHAGSKRDRAEFMLGTYGHMQGACCGNVWHIRGASGIISPTESWKYISFLTFLDDLYHIQSYIIIYNMMHSIFKRYLLFTRGKQTRFNSE